MTTIQTNTDSSSPTKRQIAIITGIAILTMAIAAAFSIGFVFNSLVVDTDAELTAQNLQQSEVLFRAAVLGLVIILICDVLASWGLHVVFQAVHKNLSLLTAWLRLIYTAILGSSLLNFVMVIGLIGATNNGDSILMYIHAFQNIWSIGLIVFGVHLLALAKLVYPVNNLHNIWSWLLFLAGLGYILNNTGNLMLPNYAAAYKATVEGIFMLPMILGEVGLGIWLLAKGGKTSPS